MLPVCVRAARQGHSRHAGHHQEDLHVTQLQDQDVHAGVRSGDHGHSISFSRDTNKKWRQILLVSVPYPDPADPHVFWPPGSISQRYGSGSFYHQAKIVRKPLIPIIL